MTIVSIESHALRDLALTEANAASVAGGRSVRKHKPAPAHSGQPLMIVQKQIYAPTEVSANSGDDDCATEDGGMGLS
jgi:hypothetical protein